MLLPADVTPPLARGNYVRPEGLYSAILTSTGRAGRTAVSNSNSGAVAPTNRHDASLRVMTYNVHACIGMDGQLSPERIARIIKQSHADVVALQELDANRARTGYRDQAMEIARLLEMDCHFHPTWSLEEEAEYGNAVLSRHPLRLVRRDSLPRLRSREPRGAMWVELTLPCGQRVQLINSHLSVYPFERREQAKALSEQWVPAAAANGPTILCGDFNAGQRSISYGVLSHGMHDVQTYSDEWPTGNTWFSPKPLARIDHIFATDGFRIGFAKVVQSRLASKASDHLPLLAELHVHSDKEPANASPNRQAWCLCQECLRECPVAS